MFPMGFFHSTAHRSSNSAKQFGRINKLENLENLEKLETIDELSPLELKEKQIQEEMKSLRIQGATEVSDKYQTLVQERQRLADSPRSIGSPLPSPTKTPHYDLNEHRRSPRNMRLSLLRDAMSNKSPELFVATRGAAKPILMPTSPVKTPEYSDKQAFGISVLKPSFETNIMGGDTTALLAAHFAGSSDSANSSVLVSSMESSQFSQSAASSFSDTHNDTQFPFSNASNTP